MQDAIRLFGVVAGIVAFLLCAIAGMRLNESSDDKAWKLIGLYFIGKGVFVGASLIVMSLRDLPSRPE
jgi:hypothetical protein